MKERELKNIPYPWLQFTTAKLTLDFSSLTSLLRPFKEFLLYLLAAITYWSSDEDDDPGSDFDRSIALGETEKIM